MDKIEISFLSPISIIVNLNKFEISLEEPITLKVLEQKLISFFPELKKSTDNLSNIIYIINGKRVFDKNMYIEAGSKIKLMAPLYGG